MSAFPGQVPSPIGVNPDGTVAERYCVKCGYLLRGLPRSNACPECGTPIELSLREPTLAGAGDEYKATLKRGLSFILNSILLMIVVAVGMFGVALAGMWMGWGQSNISNAMAAGQGLTFLVSIMSFAGYWWYTTPDPAQVAMENQRAPRRVIRVTVLVQVACALGSLILIMGFGVNVVPQRPGAGTPLPPGAQRDLLEAVFNITGWVSAVAWAVQYFAVMRYTRWVAGRVPDATVVAKTKKYMWLLPVLSTVGILLLGLGPLIAMILYWNLLNRMRKHVTSIIASGTPAYFKN